MTAGKCEKLDDESVKDDPTCAETLGQAASCSLRTVDLGKAAPWTRLNSSAGFSDQQENGLL